MPGSEPEEPTPDAEVGVDDAPAPREDPGRIRLVDVRADRDDSHGLAVTVELEWEGEIHAGAARGVGTSLVEIRLGAQATLEALCRCAGDPEFASLVGVKTVHAFDAEVVLVSVRCREAPGRNLVGAVPLEGRDTTRTAAAAALDAVNRVAGPALKG